MVTLPWVAYF